MFELYCSVVVNVGLIRNILLCGKAFDRIESVSYRRGWGFGEILLLRLSLATKAGLFWSAASEILQEEAAAMPKLYYICQLSEPQRPNILFQSDTLFMAGWVTPYFGQRFHKI